MRSLPFVFSLFAAIAPAFSQVQDAPAVDVATLLKELSRIREQQTVQAKQTRQTALQQINAAAASGERAVAMWEEAVRAVQFDGAPKENAGFRDWKDKDGEALNGPLARNAARLYFTWLGLTIERDAGTPVKDMLPKIIAYTKELAADQAAEDALEDAIKRERESAAGNNKRAPQRKTSDDQVKKMHDQILRRAVGSSPVVQWMRISDFVSPEKWEKQPGNLDGIYTQTILPELRAQRDPRVIEYWDYKLKREGEAAAKTKLAFDIEKFTTQRRPALIWNRAEEMLLIGQKNRAIGDMFTLIRTYPQHPEATGWISRLEAVLAPPAPATTSETPAAPAGSAQPAAGVVK